MFRCVTANLLENLSGACCDQSWKADDYRNDPREEEIISDENSNTGRYRKAWIRIREETVEDGSRCHDRFAGRGQGTSGSSNNRRQNKGWNERGGCGMVRCSNSLNSVSNPYDITPVAKR